MPEPRSGEVTALLASAPPHCHTTLLPTWQRLPSVIDVDDVARGNEPKMRENTPDDWVWSENQAPEAIIEDV
jgi:hypothetical protein